MTSQRDESGQQPAPPPSGGKSGNFRSSYYEKVGFKGVDERKALQAILASNPVNIEKLKLFVLKSSSSLHDTNRLLVWKILLGETHSHFPKAHVTSNSGIRFKMPFIIAFFHSLQN